MVKEFELKNVVNIESVDLVDLITKINEITKIVGITDIANIASLDLIDRITLIDEITKIGEISKIRDIMHTPSSFITNPSFEQGLAGWHYEDAEIDTQVRYYGHSCKFPSGVPFGFIWQQLLIPLGVDWLTEFYFYLRSGTGIPTGSDVFDVISYYTDGGYSADHFQIGTLELWEKKVITPTAGKYIEAILFHPTTSVTDFWVDTITTVM